MARSKSVMLGVSSTKVVLNQFPYYASFKLDGIRGRVENGLVMSRKDKPVPSEYIHSLIYKYGLPEGLEFEMVSGLPYGDNVFKKTVSAVMTQGDDLRDITLWVHDILDNEMSFEQRLEQIDNLVTFSEEVKPLPQTIVHTEEEVNSLFSKALNLGYEGLILKRANARYKFGRATKNSQEMIKIKNFEEDEGIILDVLPQVSQDKTRQNIAGAILLDFKGEQISVGTGFTFEEAAYLLDNKEELIGKKATFKYMGYGTDKKPRHPVWKGIREDKE